MFSVVVAAAFSELRVFCEVVGESVCVVNPRVGADFPGGSSVTRLLVLRKLLVGRGSALASMKLLGRRASSATKKRIEI